MMSTSFPPIIYNAIIRAIEAHDGQRREDEDEPYIEHPMRVAYTVANEFDDVNLFAAAILHDILEDSDKNIDDFPERVRYIVNLLTKEDGESKDHAISKLGGNREALIIKLADRLDNYVGDGPFTVKYRVRERERTKLLLSLAEEVDLQNTDIFKRLKTIYDSDEEKIKEKGTNFSALCKSLDTWYSLVQSRSSFGPLVSDEYMTGVVLHKFTEEEQRLIQNAIFNLSPQIIVEAAKILAEEFEQHKKEWEEEKNDLLYIVDKLKNISEK